jgi:amidase
MAVNAPTPAQLRAVAEELGLSLTDADIDFHIASMAGTVAAYQAIDALPDHLPEVKYPRAGGYRPGHHENRLNAWAWKASIKGRARGPLAGKTVVIKDNVCVAGLPMMNGSTTLEGYVPNVDATLVTRILDAGGEIVGKAVCECFCLSGGSHTSQPLPVHNPRKYGWSAGGSSSGSAALVAAGEVDMAIGGDQGGSIRIPSAYSGTYGMKATWGLVPYTGVMPIEQTIDHAGPITGNVADNALLLEAIAGADGLDPRQAGAKTAKYTAALGKDIKGLKIGVLREGFGHANSEKDVDAKVKLAAKRLQKKGAAVSEVSVPMHLLGPAIWTPIALEGLQWQMMRGNGLGMNWKGLYVTSLLDAHSNWRSRADELSLSLKISMLSGEFFIEHHRGHFYAKCQNLARQLTAAYDTVLAEHDLLLLPTLPLKATKLPAQDAAGGEILQRAFEMIGNTAPFDVTGHPAMSVPCGLSDDLPIGMMLVGRHWDESTIYRAAHAFEQAGDWQKM